MNDDDLTLTAVTLTTRERRVCGRALQIAATMMDALDNRGRGVRGGGTVGAHRPGDGRMSADPAGAVYVELTVSGRWAISYLTKDWSEADKQALLDGTREAWDALRDAAAQQTLASPDDVDTESVRIHAAWEDAGRV